MASFVRKDYEILSSRFKMYRRFYRGNLHAIPDRVAIFRGIRRTDFNCSWFGYLQAYWALQYSRKLGKRSVVILGGFDVCEEEDPRLTDRLFTVQFILRNADCLIACSERVRRKALAIEPKARISLIYHGFDPNQYTPGSKQPSVVTIGYVRQPNLVRKGLEVFVRAAARLPNIRFFLVGAWVDQSIGYLRSIATPNVRFTGQLPDGELVKLLQSAAVYVQASSHEGFGCSLAEAMLAECVPVVSDRGAIPEVVGETGVYVDPTDEKDVARGIAEALNSPSRGGPARNRIATSFPLDRRRIQLLQAIEDVLV